jgi:hypothetical protein
VRDLRQERTEGDHQPHLELLREVEHGPAVRLPPQVRLDPHRDDDVAARARAEGELELGPDDLAVEGPRHETHERPL